MRVLEYPTLHLSYTWRFIGAPIGIVLGHKSQGLPEGHFQSSGRLFPRRFTLYFWGWSRCFQVASLSIGNRSSSLGLFFASPSCTSVLVFLPKTWSTFSRLLSTVFLKQAGADTGQPAPILPRISSRAVPSPPETEQTWFKGKRQGLKVKAVCHKRVPLDQGFSAVWPSTLGTRSFSVGGLSCVLWDM